MSQPPHTSGHGQPPVRFTIDGEPFETSDRHQTAATLLTEFAQLSPTDYDLGELHGNSPEPHVYADNDIVTIHPAARFVSLRTGPGNVE